MKKMLLFLTVLLLPYLSKAQQEPAVQQDFGNNIKDYSESFAFDDHLNISQLNTNNKSFDLVATNDKMQEVWRKSYIGFAITSSKIANKIIALATTDYSILKGKNSIYKAYIINPANGDVLTEKIIYEGEAKLIDLPILMKTSNSHFVLGLRQTDLEHRLHMALPGPFALLSLNKYSKQYQKTNALTIVEFDEKLNQSDSIKLKTYDGSMVNLSINSQGDVFASWINNGRITVDRYLHGQNKPSGQLTSDLVLSDDNGVNSQIAFFPSTTNKNILYCSLIFKNSSKEHELRLDKMDFTTMTTAHVNEILSKDHLKDLEKSFTPVNPKIKKPDLGSPGLINIRYLYETNEQIIVAMAGKIVQTGTNTFWTAENALIVNGYDSNLRPKFQQVLPSGYTVNGGGLPYGFHINKNKFYVIANDNNGPSKLNGLYGVLNLDSGNWEKMEWLSKKKIGSTDFSNGSMAFWFADNFLLPYYARKGLINKTLDVSLQQNEY